VQNLQKLDRGLISMKHRGFFAKLSKILINELFPTVKVMDWVHASVDRPGALNPPWTDDGVDRGGARRGVALTGVRPPAAPVHQSSPAGAE
jgi:hypothetical protein